jgi:hypothetical protein
MTAQPSGTDRGPEHTGIRWRKAWAESHPDDERHGEMSFYNYWHCRCPKCRRAKHDYRINLYHPVVVNLFHEATPYTVAEHRAFGETLCPACASFLQNFSG